MRIVAVAVAHVPVNSRGDWLFISLRTDGGLAGYGEISQSGDDALATWFMKERVGPALMTMELGAIGGVMGELRRRFPNHASGMSAVGTVLAGVELALWDLRARSLGVPLYELFGGRLHDRIKLYANINRGAVDRSCGGFATAAAQAVAEGFEGVKCAPFDGLRWGYGDLRDGVKGIDAGVARVAAVRDAIGPGPALMVDCHSRLSRELALYVIEALGPYRLTWLEEPLALVDGGHDGATLGERSQIPIAGGESVADASAGFQLLKHGGVSVLMPDIKCCGLWTARVLSHLAEGLCIPVSPHNPSGPVATMGSAHLAAALPNFLALEFPWGEVPWRARLTVPEECVRDGSLILPSGPGLGIDLNEFPYET